MAECNQRKAIEQQNQSKKMEGNTRKMDELKTLIQEAFGESSEDSEDEQQQEDSNNGGGFQLVFGENPKWERITEINGLSLCRDFLTPDQQSSFLTAIEKEGWFSEASYNQAMRFGDLPAWANELSTCIREVVHFSDYDSKSMDIAACEKNEEAFLFPSELLWREPLFDQLIVNSYQPGEGICAHVDLMRFEDGIALVSLESPCVMHFSRVDQIEVKIPVYLTPGCLLLLWGEARYLWKHEINRKPGFQKWEGLELDQKRRTSITLRKLCHSD